MRRLKLNEDTKSVSEFRANAAELIEQVKTSGRPLVLTERGHSTVVLLDVNDYEGMIEGIELFRDVRTAIGQIDGGEGLTNEQARTELSRRFHR